MATRVETIPMPGKIRVAVVMERGTIKPVWFEALDKPSRDRVYITAVNYVWHHVEGSAKVISYAVSDGSNCYRLSLNTRDLTWQLGIAIESPC